MFTLPDMPYAYDALEPFIDARTMQIHHEKHHGAYVKNLNDAIAAMPQLDNVPIEELLKMGDQIPEPVRTKVRNNGGGHYNHSLFWTIMAPRAGGKPTGDLAKAIDAAFGDFATFQEKFSAAAMGRFGSGWAWLCVENGTLVVEDSPNQDNPWMQGRTPILGLDVWEHAYYLTYQNRRADYVRAWWNVVNWQEVGRRFQAAS